MHLHLLAVGKGMPGWVREAYEDYARRLHPAPRLLLTEVEAGRRGRKVDAERQKREEGQALLAAVPPGARVVALDPRGKQRSTPELARWLASWMQEGRDVALLVGGPEGLSEECLAAAEARWSLSRLTLPHPMVRVILSEQLYRAWSILQGHPYHR